jgi:UDP-3-O-[3-hydroxymyristoyl] glucosamine N-acyltransferase
VPVPRHLQAIDRAVNRRSMKYTLGSLADALGVEVNSAPETEVWCVGTIQAGGAGTLGFLANKIYQRYLPATKLAAIIVTSEHADAAPVPALISENPYATYARAAAMLSPARAVEPGVHAAAWVSPEASIDPSAQIGPGAVVEAGAEVAGGAYIGANSVVGRNASIGPDTRLVASVTLCDEVRVGARCLFHPGVVIGGDGYGIANDAGLWVKVPQLGSVRIGDDVEIGANTTVDRGALEDTVLGDGVKLDNQIQIAHNVCVGEHTVIAGCTAIAGSTTVGAHCMIAGGVGIVGHIEIADRVVITAMTLVTSSIRQPGTYSGSLPMDDAVSWRRNSVRYRQLDDMARRLRRLERDGD